RHHPLERPDAYSVNHSVLAQRAFSFRTFLGQNVALESLGPDNLARAGYFESFGGGAVGPDLGHYGYPPLTQIFGVQKSIQAGRNRLKPNRRKKAAHTGRDERLAFHPPRHKNNSLFRT